MSQNIEITKLLHQRPPYLMVSDVIEITNDYIQVLKIHDTSEAHFEAHFPGAPVVPGAMLQEVCTQGAGILITKFHSPVGNYDSEVTKGHALGVLKKVNYAKYFKIVSPKKPIMAKIELIDLNYPLFKFSARVFQDKELVAKMSFNLANTKDEILF